MDLLKDITRELRGNGETRRDDRPRTSRTGRDTDRRGSAGDTDDPQKSADDQTNDRTRGDEHVCPFCETEFEATRGTCPDCDAEIVLRGER